MDTNYMMCDNFRKLLTILLENPFGKTKIEDFGSLIPFENKDAEEVFIEDGRCFVRHNKTFVTYFYTEGDYLDNYEFIKRIVNKYNIALNSFDNRSKQYFIDEIKNLLDKNK